MYSYALGLLLSGIILSVFIGGAYADERDILRPLKVSSAQNIREEHLSAEEKQSVKEGDGSLILSAEEKDFIINNPVVRYCVDPFWMPYEGISPIGQHIGISADYIMLLSRKIGITFELYPTESWAASIQAAREQECDFLPLARDTKERRRFLDFSETYSTFPYMIATQQGAPYLPNISDNLEKRFAVVQGYALADYLRSRYPAIQLVEVDHIDEGIKKLRMGEVDGYLDSMLTLGYYIRENGVLDIKIAGKTGYMSRLAIASHNAKPVLGRLLQKALNATTEVERKVIMDRWLTISYDEDLDRNLKTAPLSIQEASYLSQNPSVRLCVNPNRMPFEAIVGGKYVGIAADILNLVARRAQVEIKLVESDNWIDSFDKFKEGACDIISMLNRTSSRDQFMTYTDPYFTGHIVFIGRKEHGYIADPLDILGKTVAIPKGYSIRELLHRDFGKQITVLEAENYQEAFEMVSQGRADLTADYLLSGGERINKLGLDGLEVVGNSDYRNKLRIGVQDELPILRTILEKSVNTLEIHEVNAIVNRWRTIHYDQRVDYTVVWLLSGGAGFIIFVFVLWNRQIAKAHQKTQNALEKLEQVQLELERLAVTDKLTNIYNRTKLDQVLLDEAHRAQRFKHDFALILIDIDYFKSINDCCGHQMGDRVLQFVATCLGENIRDTDILGRWGGEEFMVICPETNLIGGKVLAEKLRQEVEKLEINPIDRVTASFGVAVFAHYKTDQIENLVLRADRALYASKNAGRNIVTTQ